MNDRPSQYNIRQAKPKFEFSVRAIIRTGLAVLKYSFVISGIILTLGYLFPSRFQMPVQGAGKKDYNQKSYWHYPWGRSGTHKGVDIFSAKGTAIKPGSPGWVFRVGEMSRGGKYVIVLSAKWRFHYYAHLNDIYVKQGQWVSSEQLIASVGNSGNAVGKPPHLHYAIVTPIPYVWRADNSPQGWKKMFYLNPIDYLNESL